MATKTVRTYSDLADDIRRRAAPTMPRLVAVDGASGAGKSTFARRLASALDSAEVIEMDDFVSWSNLAGWWPRLEEQVLRPLTDGGSVTYQQRNWHDDPFGDRLGAWRTVPPSQVLILEGVTSSRRAIADRLTLAIWVDAPPEVRLQRGIDRDGEGMRDAWLEWGRREDEFFDHDHTLYRADLHVDGTATIPHDPEREFICGSTNPERAPGARGP